MEEWSHVLRRSAWKAVSFDIFINGHNKKKKTNKQKECGLLMQSADGTSSRGNINN